MYQLHMSSDGIHFRFSKNHEQSKHPSTIRRIRRRFGQSNGNGDAGYLTERTEAGRLKWLNAKLAEEGMNRARQLGWTDSYTLTKAIGEQLLARERGGLPVVIIRPSIIESSLQEPEPGWVDGLKVTDGIIVPYGRGQLHDFPGNPEVTIDTVPVDFVVNVILASVPQATRNGGIRVHHVSSGSANPVKLRDLFDLVYDYFRKFPMIGKRGEPVRVRRWTYPSPSVFRFFFWARYQLPLGRLEWFLRKLSWIARGSRLRRRIAKRKAIYGNYTSTNFEFRTENTTALLQSLKPQDKKRFDFDVTRIRWPDYVQNIHISGLKRHVLNTGKRESQALR